MASLALGRAIRLRTASCRRQLRRATASEADRLETSWRLFSRSSQATPSGSSLEALSREIRDLFEQTRPSEEELEAKDMLFRKIEAAGKESLDGCRAEAFGSAGCGQWTAGSDLDICLLAPGVTERHSQVRGLKKVASILRQSGASHNIEPRFGAQMPILRWTPRRKGRPSSIACDISVANVLAVANTQLIAAYLNVDERVPLLLRAVKVWARERGINNRQRGTFSSFALTLMLLHVLQRRPSPVVPSLQDIAVANGTPALYLSGVDCRFCSDAEEITATLQEQQGDLGQNKESLAALLFEFFRFFSYEYEHGVIAIRSPSGITRDEEGRSFFIVENPFEPGKDVANIEVRLYTRLREEFRRAHALLAEGASLSSLCEMPPAPGLDPLAGPILPGVNAPLCPPAKGSGLWRMSESKRSWD